MSQHDYVMDNQNGASSRADINSAFAAIASNNSGATEPATKYSYEWWADTTAGLLKLRNAANSAWVSILNLATGLPIFPAPSAAADPVRATDLQAQTVTAFTTGGTSTAYTLTPTPAITSLVAGQRFRVKFNATAGVAPTLAISGQPAKNLKVYDSTGTKVAASATSIILNMLTDVEYDGTDYVILDQLPGTSSGSSKIQSISASVAANALTISASALTLDFRSATLTSGTVTTVSGTPANLVISSGSTLGQTSGASARLAVLALNNAGAIELAVCNVAGQNNLDEAELISTTAEGGAGAADSQNVIYSTTARTNVAYRVIGYLDNTQATAGTWATAPSKIQGIGGQIFLSSKLALGAKQATTYGTTKDFTAPYPNPKKVTINFVGLRTSGTSDKLIQIGDAGGIETSGYLGTGGTITPSGFSYITGFGILDQSASNVLHGSMTLVLVDPATFTWCSTHLFTISNNQHVRLGSGSKSLSQELTTVRVTTLNGTDTFAAGSINVLWEY